MDSFFIHSSRIEIVIKVDYRSSIFNAISHLTTYIYLMYYLFPFEILILCLRVQFVRLVKTPSNSKKRPGNKYKNEQFEYS